MFVGCQSVSRRCWFFDHHRFGSVLPEALVVAARAFLANHRLDPSLDLLDRRIRLDADSDSESEDGILRRWTVVDIRHVDLICIVYIVI